MKSKKLYIHWLALGCFIAWLIDLLLTHPTGYRCDPGTIAFLAISASQALAPYTNGWSGGLLGHLMYQKQKKPPNIDRGKQDDIRLSLPGYGESIVKAWGTFRCAPTWIWHTPIVHTVNTTPGQSGGKGPPKPPTADTVDHIYTTSLAGVFHDGLIQYVKRIWFDTDLVFLYDPTQESLSSTKYEGEHAILAGGASVTTQAECSDGMKVTGIGSGGSATCHVDVDSTGNYVCAVHYTSTVDRTFKVSVNGGASVDLFCAASGAASIVAIETITLALTSGANTIAFANAGAACPDLDYIDLIPELSFENGEDRRSFSGLVDTNKIAATDQDQAWAAANERPVFSDPTGDGGQAGGGFFTATLAKYGQPQIRIHLGSETQDPDSAIIADKGAGNAPAFRGSAYLVIEGLQLQGGRIPNVTIEAVQGVREARTIVQEIYGLCGVDSSNLDLSALNGMVLGDTTGFDAGTYGAITWSSTLNVATSAGGAISKNAGTENTWNARATNGSTITAGNDGAIRFTAAAGVFLMGFATTATPTTADVLFSVLLNLTSSPGLETKNAIQMVFSGNQSADVGTWAAGDRFQVEIRNGRFSVYQNGLLLTGFATPVASYPLYPVFMGYRTGGGVSAASYAAGANIGSAPTVANGGAMVLSSRRTGAELINELQTRFQFDLPEVDGVVKAVLRNGSSDLTIPYAELRAHYDGEEMPAGDALITDIDPLLSPQAVEVNYLDPQLDFHNNVQRDMRLTGPQFDQQSVSLSIVDSADNMKKLATILLYKPDMEGRSFRFQTGPKYMRVHPGTVVTLTLQNATHVVRVTEAKYGLPAGICEFEGVRQQASLYSPTATGSVGTGTEPPIVPIPGNTRGVFIDAPPIKQTDAGAGSQPMIQIAMCGRGSGSWPGAFVFKEFPAGSDNYVRFDSTDKPSGIGVTTTALPAVADVSILDEVSSIRINFYSNTELTSVTTDELDADPDLNLLAIINPDTNEAEYVQFATAAVEVATAPFITAYTISDLKRGLYDTDSNLGVHTAADTVVLMDSTILAKSMELADVHREINYKFITSGQHPEDAAIVPFTWIGNNVRPRKVTDIVIVRDGLVNWLIQFVGHPRLFEMPAQYVVEVWEDHSRTDPSKIKRQLPVTEGTSHACLLDSTGDTVTDPNETGQLIFSSHADKNNVLSGVGTATWQTIEDLQQAFSRYDFTFRVDNDSLTSTGVLIYAGLDHDDAYNTAARTLVKADSPVYIEWSENSGNIEEKIYNYGTQVGSTRSFAWDSDGETQRYSILLVGSEYRVYADYKPNTGQVPLAIIPAETGGFPFPLRLKGFLVDASIGPFYTDNVVAGGSLFPTTIYSSDQQIEDFGVEQTILFLRIYQKARYDNVGNPVDV